MNILRPEQLEMLRAVGRINRGFCEEWRKLIQETRLREEREKRSLGGRKAQAKLRAKKPVKRKT